MSLQMAPSTTPPKSLRSSPLSKLSLLIPVSTTNTNCGMTPAPLLIAATPLRHTRPKLTLKVRNEDEDITAKNTIANQRLHDNNEERMDVDIPTYTCSPTPGVKSILKKASSIGSAVSSPESIMASSFTSTSSGASCKSVSFDVVPSYIPQEYYEDEEDDELDFAMSPPSTTSSSTDEESESDNEVKTPVENTSDGWITKFAGKPGFGGSGRWKKAKREWVWTLGDIGVDPPQEEQSNQLWVAV